MFYLPSCFDCNAYDKKLEKHPDDGKLRCAECFEEKTDLVKKGYQIAQGLGHTRIPGYGEIGKPQWVQSGGGWAYIGALIKAQAIGPVLGHPHRATAHRYRMSSAHFAYAEALAKHAGALHTLCEEHYCTEYLHQREVFADKARAAYKEFADHYKWGQV